MHPRTPVSRTIGWFIAALVLGTAVPALGQLRGTVTDEQGQFVADASVEVSRISASGVGFGVQAGAVGRGQRWQVRTNSTGEYIIDIDTSGTYLVRSSKGSVGSGAVEVELTFGELKTVNLHLRRAVAPRVTPHCAGSNSAEMSRRSSLAAGVDPGLARLLGWVEAVRRHTPGCIDPAASAIGEWPQRELEILLRDIRELVKFLARAEQGRSEQGDRQDRDRLVFVIYSRQITLDQLERTLYGGESLIANQLLRRGAVLHADIAAYVPGTLSGEPLVEDGGRKGWRAGTTHWEIGRQLLDSIAPSPANDTGTSLWYRAVSAHLLHGARLAEASPHLEKARQLFPAEPVFLLDSAYLHEELSSPAVQAARDVLRADGVNVAVAAREAELQRAERFLRQAANLSREDAVIRVRLGRTLGELGRHQEAAAELRLAIEAKPDKPLLYLAELFLGRAEQARGRRDESKRHFENAAALYPHAQAPQLALGELARQSGDRRGAMTTIQRLAERPTSAEDSDPWWSYYRPHQQDAMTLMEEMRTLASW